jgi:peptidyl-prolyl cis-trans isomerase B (cyclophilin B)
MRSTRPRGRTRAALWLIPLTLLAACKGGIGEPPIACPTSAPSAGEATTILADAVSATVDTSLGSFAIALRGDVAPIATANFVALARCGFYDGVTFHRVLAGVLVQAGDPNTKLDQGDFEGLGTGGPGYGFAAEVPPDGVNYDPYAVAMAQGALNSNGSQFFICLADLNGVLPRTYTVFGQVSEGTEVVDAIGAAQVINGIGGVPVDPIVIDRITINAPESTPS